MRPYQQITGPENDRRTRELYEFRNLLHGYFDHVVEDADGGVQHVDAKDVASNRAEINRRLTRVHDITRAAGIHDTYHYRAPRVAGGWAANTELVPNIFQLLATAARHSVTPIRAAADR